MAGNAEISIGLVLDSSGVKRGVDRAVKEFENLQRRVAATSAGMGTPKGLAQIEQYTQVHQASGHLSKAFADVQPAALKLGDALSGVRTALNRIGMVALPVMAGVGMGLFKAASLASDFNETLSKTAIVFGASASVVLSAADEMAGKFGVSKKQFLDAADGIGLIGKAAGMGQPAAAQLGAELAKLAVDASSFYDVPLEEALRSFRSGLVGEAEPMRRFGVMLSEAAVKAEALRLGLVRGNAELSESAKIQARIALMRRGLTDASGDRERTASSPKNLAREAMGRVENVLTDLGQNLQAPLQTSLQALSAAIGEIGTAFEGAGAYIADWGAGTAEVFKVVLGSGISMFQSLGEWLAWGTRKFHEFRGGLLSFGADAARMLGNTALEDELRGKAKSDWDTLDRLNGVTQATDKVKGAATGMGAALKDAFSVGSEAAAAAAKRADELGKRVGDLTKKLFEERATFGMTSRQAELYKLQLGGASDAQIRMAYGMSVQLDAMDKAQKRYDDLASGAAGLIDQTQTAEERLQAETTRIGQMLDAGLIDPTTAARAYRSANQKSGLYDVQYAGAMTQGSEAARSALLKADQALPGGKGPDDELRAIAEQARDTGAATAQMNAAIQQMHAMMRQMLTTTSPVTGAL